VPLLAACVLALAVCPSVVECRKHRRRPGRGGPACGPNVTTSYVNGSLLAALPPALAVASTGSSVPAPAPAPAGSAMALPFPEPGCTPAELAHAASAWEMKRSLDYHCQKEVKGNASLWAWQDKVGAKVLAARAMPGLRMAKTLFVAETAEAITDEVVARIPGNYVIKAAHGSQMTMLVFPDSVKCLATVMMETRGTCPGRGVRGAGNRSAFIRRVCAHWLTVDFGRMSRQPSYSRIKRTCLFEESLAGPSGALPPDVKIYTFQGEPLFLYVSRLRGASFTNEYVATDWRAIPMSKHYKAGQAVSTCGESQAVGTALPKPSTLAKYIRYARALAAGFPAVGARSFSRDCPV